MRKLSETILEDGISKRRKCRNHLEKGPDGGIVTIEDTTILDMAKK